MTRFQKKEVGPNSDDDNLHEEHAKPPEQETSLQSHDTDGSDESDVVEHDVSINPVFSFSVKQFTCMFRI